MAHSFRLKFALLSVSLIGLSGCGLASLPGGYTPIEQQTVNELSGANYVPRTADERAAILTQDLFAQAAFWSREYDLNPADLEAAVNLSSALRRLDNPGKSIEIATQTRALYPRDADLMIELGASYIANNKPRKAIEHLDDALQQRPAQGRIWSLKGAALDQLEMFKQARQHYSKALSFAPNDASTMANVGLSYALEGDPQTAEVWLRRAANQPGASATVRQNLALILGLQGKTEEAEKWVNRDLKDLAADNNMQYLRSLRSSAQTPSSAKRSRRGETVRQAPRRKQVTPMAYSQPIARTSAAPQTRARPLPLPPQTQPNYSNNFTVVADPSQSSGGPKTASDIVRATTQKRKTSSPVRRISQAMPNSTIAAPRQLGSAAVPTANASNNVLKKIAYNNKPKHALAQQQQKQLANRAQANAQINAQARAQYMANQQAAYAAQQAYIGPQNPSSVYYGPQPQGYIIQNPQASRVPARTRRN